MNESYPIDLEYFNWLYSQIGVLSDNNPSTSHFILAEILFRIEYRWYIANDDNREMDGLLLRDKFCDLHGSWEDSHFYESPCTVLEMLIALAKRVSFETDGLIPNSTLGDWFWHMMSNLDLKRFTDSGYLNNALDSDIIITGTIRKMMDRDIAYNGEGGLFPLRYPQRDQRKVEIWYQMSAYLLENSNLNL